MSNVMDMTVAPADSGSRSKWIWDAVGRRPVIPLIVLGLGCALVAWIRIPPVARDTLWAEDGRIFLSWAALDGPSVLFAPYAGYLHTVPRLVAAGVVLLPLEWWAVATTAAACLIAGGLAVVVFVSAQDLVPWVPARLLVAGLTVFAPYAPREVLGNLANLHSLFLWALFWIVLSRPRSLPTAMVLATVALLGTLTEIQALLLVPLLLLRSRDRLVWIVRAGLMVGMAVQLVVTLGWPRPQNTNPPVDALSIAYGYLINVLMPLVVPQAQLGHVLVAVGPALGLVVLAVISAGVVYVGICGTRAQRFLVIAAVCLSVLIYAACVETNPNSFYDYARLSTAQLSTAWITRYGVVPSMLCALVVPVAATIAVRRRHHQPALSWPVIAAAALAAVLVVAQFGPQWTRRSDGPAWQPQLAAATSECRHDGELRFVTLRETIGWSTTVPCVDVTGRTDDDA